MKSYLVILTLVFGQVALAGTINLGAGESISIQANSPTTVTCGAAGNCALPVKNLKTKFDYCKSQVNSRVEDCLEEVWPEFVKKNPRCVEDGTETCLNFCKTAVFSLDCLSICRQEVCMKFCQWPVACLLVSVFATTANATLIPEDQAHFDKESYQTLYISKKVFNQELALMQKAFSPLAEARNEKLMIAPDWTANDWANAMSRRWPPEDQIIVYSGLAYRKEISTDALALIVCHELGHLFGGEPLRDEYNQISNEGQADYWGTQACLQDAFKLFDYKDDSTIPREGIVLFCENHSELDSVFCVRALKAAERIGSFFAHNANKPEPKVETPDQSVVDQTIHTHNSPQCRLDTFVAGLLKLDRPRCWYSL